MRKLLLTIIGVITIGGLAHGAGAPQIIGMTPEEACGRFPGMRPSIAVDSKGQPHIVVDTGGGALGSTLWMFNKIGGRWQNRMFANRTSEPSVPGTGSIAQPWVAIDKNDRMWVFAQYFLGGVMRSSGQGVWMYDNMTTAPRKVWFHKKQYGSYGWGPGNLDIDPKYPNEAVVVTINGEYGVVDSSGKTIKTGGMGPRGSGEKIRFRIAPYKDGSRRGVWHAVMNGASSVNSAYRNTLLSRDVTWASYASYRSQGDDHNHAGVCGDRENPAIGYMAAVFEDGGSHHGLQFNVWNGSRMVYSASQLGILDPNAMFVNRYGPAMVGAFGGGCWFAWGDNGGTIWLAYVSQKGEILTRKKVAAGYTCAINTDKDGNLHMAYARGGVIFYRMIKLTEPGAASRAPLADFDGDGYHDLCSVTEDGYWQYRLSSTDEKKAVKWGVSGDVPVPGHYEQQDEALILEGGEGGFDQPAVFRQETGEWIIRNYDGTKSVVKLGKKGDIPVPADFDGDGITDCAVFTPKTGTWTFSMSSGNSAPQIKFGKQGQVPFAFDAYDPTNKRSYDTDDRPDLVMWSPEKGEWYIKCSDGREYVQGFGAKQDNACPGDYDGDGNIDFAVFRTSTQYWYIRQSTTDTMATQKWGIPNDVPCPGKYEVGEDKWNIAVCRRTRFHVKKNGGDSWKLGESPVYLGGVNHTPVPGAYRRNKTGAPEVSLTSYDPKSGWWYSGYMDGSVSFDKWGIPGDRAVPADYDEDGLLDRAVYRDGWWYIDHSFGGGHESYKWGIAGDTPVPGDYDGDGDIDLCVYRSGFWYIRGKVFDRQKWGVVGDQPFPGDYDGDDITDLAIYRPSTGFWYIRMSENNTMLRIKCGVPARKDRPMPNDYDGDGLMDPAVFVASEGLWVYVSSKSGYKTYEKRYLTREIARSATDKPVVADYDGDGNLDLGVIKGTRIGKWYIDLNGEVMQDPRAGIAFQKSGVPLGNR